jgi:hypothetical protein
MDVDSDRNKALGTGSKRERSRERNGRESHDSSRQHDGRHHRRSPELDRKSAEPSSKRPKHEPTS